MPISLRARVPGAASAQVTRIGDRTVVLVEVHGDERRGALGLAGWEVLAEAARLARQVRLPFVARLASSGADIAEGIGALHGWGRAAQELAACSGVVPTICTVTGPAVSGPALLLGLADHVVMTESSYAFVSGPTMVAQFTGIQVGIEQLGGADVHARHSGVATLVVPDGEDLSAAAALLSYLPDHADALAPPAATADPPERPTPELRHVIPQQPSGGYDVRDVLRAVADDGELLEVRSRFAPNVITAFGSVGRRSVGFVANQPIALAGTLDIPASQKAARFVATCDAFNLPILTFVDTPGFYPGKDLEWRGMIRHGAQLVMAYARATVPRMCVILRKSYGGAYIVMDAKTMGNDLCLAWPGAELAVMGARGAVEILHRRASPAEREGLERAYEAQMLNPWVAADRGYVDAVIDPIDTRAQLAAALDVLDTKREHLSGRSHDNGPL